MVVHLEARMERRRMVGQHHVELVQCQFGQQVGHFTLQTHQSQAFHLQHRAEQPLHLQPGQAIGNAHHQTHRWVLRSGMYQLGQGFAELEDGFRLPRGHHARLGQRQAALQLADLGAHSLQRHVEPCGSVGHAALLGHHPEIVEMAVVEGG